MLKDKAPEIFKHKLLWDLNDIHLAGNIGHFEKYRSKMNDFKSVQSETDRGSERSKIIGLKGGRNY